jgi:hypothetical protein
MPTQDALFNALVLAGIARAYRAAERVERQHRGWTCEVMLADADNALRQASPHSLPPVRFILSEDASGPADDVMCSLHLTTRAMALAVGAHIDSIMAEEEEFTSA